MAYAEPVAAIVCPRILAREGRPAEHVLERLFAQLHLSFVPPSLEDPAVPLPAMAHGPRARCCSNHCRRAGVSWLANLPDRPTIYVTGGTIRRSDGFFEPVIEGVRDLNVNLVATLGRLNAPELLGPQPEHVHLTRYVSQSLLLPTCAVVVNHGGFSSVLGALTCGVPLVVLPNGADRSVNARRAAELGVAIVLDEDQRTPAAIQAAVRSVLDDSSYRLRAQAIQAEIAALPNPDQGVRLLEQLVARHVSPASVRGSSEAAA